MHNGMPTMKYYIMVWSPLQEKQKGDLQIMKKKFKKMFETYQERIPEIKEVEQVEARMAELNKRLKAIDSDLAEEFDRAIGRIAWEYEKQGFCGGVMVAKSLL